MELYIICRLRPSTSFKLVRTGDIQVSYYTASALLAVDDIDRNVSSSDERGYAGLAGIGAGAIELAGARAPLNF